MHVKQSRIFKCRKFHYCKKAKPHLNDFNKTKNFKQNTPSSSFIKPKAFKNLQLPANGLRPKLDNIIHYMRSNDIPLAAIQETFLGESINIKASPSYSLVRCDRPPSRGKGGGLPFIVNDTIQFKSLQLSTPTGDS